LADRERNTKHDQGAARDRSEHCETPFNADVKVLAAEVAEEAL
jgi:hypothetical protein